MAFVFNIWIVLVVILASGKSQECIKRSGPRYNASHWEAMYDFEPLPIGGQIATVVQSGLETDDLPPGYAPGAKRPIVLQAYCLMKDDEINIFHRLPSDSTWYYIAGNALRVYTIHSDTRELTYKDIRVGEFAHVKAGDWKGAKMLFPKKGKYALVLAINAPGVIPPDVAMPPRSEMLEMYPEHAEVIEMLTFSEPVSEPEPT